MRYLFRLIGSCKALMLSRLGVRGVVINLAGLALLSFSLCVAWVLSGSCSCKWSACNSLCWRNRLRALRCLNLR
ncbi:hypothetical protein BGZ57DRAFT_448840 [Hyaloscypha finlandica]|nr:hypothetical protein BGZ57DRAFT_448840 [Hyaloscypha finlandica]